MWQGIPTTTLVTNDCSDLHSYDCDFGLSTPEIGLRLWVSSLDGSTWVEKPSFFFTPLTEYSSDRRQEGKGTVWHGGFGCRDSPLCKYEDHRKPPPPSSFPTGTILIDPYTVWRLGFSPSFIPVLTKLCWRLCVLYDKEKRSEVSDQRVTQILGRKLRRFTLSETSTVFPWRVVGLPPCDSWGLGTEVRRQHHTVSLKARPSSSG